MALVVNTPACYVSNTEEVAQRSSVQASAYKEALV